MENNTYFSHSADRLFPFFPGAAFSWSLNGSTIVHGSLPYSQGATVTLSTAVTRSRLAIVGSIFSSDVKPMQLSPRYCVNSSILIFKFNKNENITNNSDIGDSKEAIGKATVSNKHTWLMDSLPFAPAFPPLISRLRHFFGLSLVAP